MSAPDNYLLDEQVGHLLRRANQRHTAIFARLLNGIDLTPLQFAAVMKLSEKGELSQNELGRLTAMDPNTIQGVVLRLQKLEMVERRASDTDKRRKLLTLTDKARDLVGELATHGVEISGETLAPLNRAEKGVFLELLKKLT